MHQVIQQLKRIKRAGIELIRRGFLLLPRPLLVAMYALYEQFYAARAARLINTTFTKTTRTTPLNVHNHPHKKNILFYHISGLSFAGTEKSLQIIAKYLDKTKYNVFFMYSAQPVAHSNGHERLDGRKSYLENTGVEFIPFEYSSVINSFPFVITDQHPSIFEIIAQKKIDLLITAGAGDATFPLNLIRDIPIIMISVFGGITVQKNIAQHVCISEEVKNKITPVITADKIKVIPIQSELPPHNVRELGLGLRKKLNIPADAFVFGRIGRPDNHTFDPIAIDAFKIVVAEYPDVHYIIMAPPPILRESLLTQPIANVHLIDPSSNEHDIWAFHGALTALAHFRYDGESQGLNIGESMLVGNPIISHTSPIWNAHLEYLDPSFSRIAPMNDSAKYAAFMREMIALYKNNSLTPLQQAARQTGEKLFAITHNINRIEQLVDNSIHTL